MSHATIHTLRLLPRGIDLRAGRDANLMRRLVVAAAMHAGAVTVDGAGGRHLR